MLVAVCYYVYDPRLHCLCWKDKLTIILLASEAGNVGSIAGPPWFSALRTSLTTANIAVQGVTYSASVGGYLAGGDAAGSTEMLRLINLASSQCPSTKIVLGGYRQVYN